MRFFFLPGALALLACSQNADTRTAATTGQRQTPAATFPETFEAGTKGAYTEADEALTTGPWHFQDGLIGSTAQDHKDGQHAARLRGLGRLTMQFDAAAGVRQITVSAAAYGTDGPSTWELWLSRDGGGHWQRAGAPVTTQGPRLVPHTFAGTAGEPLRLEIRKTSGPKTRLNFDDVVLTTATGPAVAVGGTGTAMPAPGAPKHPAPPAPTAQGPTTAPGPATDPGDNLLLGNPSGATADPANATNYLLVRPQFTSGYNATRGIPVWTSWHVGRGDLGQSPRQNDFRPDPALPRQFFQVTPQSYSGSGFDKGHNCPSGDRTASLDDNSATFLMSNMVPQAPQNNQQTWAHLEEYTRAQVQRGLEAYVLMGSYGRGGTGKNGFAQTLDQGRVTVPARIWKVVVFLPEGPDDLRRIAAGQARVVAIDTPNDNSIAPDWKQYLTSVDKIEAASGLDLLSALPPAAQAQLQKVVDSGRAN
ncbi:DNA/RNA non-specific endonuclease [Hymenobacter nivis]|uniref:DNA/RNA non-specific endonuclease n=1 Tax=Hymenobacter nivis TaxID=1850093 RepID=A0A2Z3GFD9_9BACT|nr:DNA/RNA non-specific endonuclease [Hymenobacter nivis]AWM32273.1 DNA/RNA non-specific endonuclease [Hymenobacter nivis]